MNGALESRDLTSGDSNRSCKEVDAGGFGDSPTAGEKSQGSLRFLPFAPETVLDLLTCISQEEELLWRD